MNAEGGLRLESNVKTSIHLLTEEIGCGGNEWLTRFISFDLQNKIK